MNKKQINNISLAAMFLALGMVLPFLTMQIKEIGDTLLPMHLPVMLCGIICGYKYGAAVGLLLPFLRSACFGMPPIYPNAVWMSAELLTYGLVIGLMYKLLPKKLPYLYISLLTSQIVGRIVWAAVKFLLLMNSKNPLTFAAFLSGGFVDSFIGIILQLVLIPLIISIIKIAKKDVL